MCEFFGVPQKMQLHWPGDSSRALLIPYLEVTIRPWKGHDSPSPSQKGHVFAEFPGTWNITTVYYNLG